jgi:hypothetical protein
MFNIIFEASYWEGKLVWMLRSIYRRFFFETIIKYIYLSFVEAK